MSVIKWCGPPIYFVFMWLLIRIAYKFFGRELGFVYTCIVVLLAINFIKGWYRIYYGRRNA